MNWNGNEAEIPRSCSSKRYFFPPQDSTRVTSVAWLRFSNTGIIKFVPFVCLYQQYIICIYIFVSHLRPMGTNVLGYQSHLWLVAIMLVVTKDLPISPRFSPTIFLSWCIFSTLTSRQSMVECSILTFSRFPPCVCVCVCVCVHITTQSGPVILVILCHSH